MEDSLRDRFGVAADAEAGELLRDRAGVSPLS